MLLFFLVFDGRNEQTVSMNMHSVCHRIRILAWALLLTTGQAAIAASVSRHADTASGLQGWRIQDRNIEVQLNPLTQQQVHAFYLGRGFSNSVTEQIAASCVFQTVISNVSNPELAILIDIDLSQWRIVNDDAEIKLVSKDDWIQRWSGLGASQSSRLAFRWATFPWVQQYEQTGDYGWGMILFGADLPQPFSVIVRWQTQGIAHEQQVDGLTCPE